MLDAVGDRLNELHRLLEDDDPARNRRIFTTLQELEGHLDALRGNTKRFNGELQWLLRAEGADLTTFHEVKSATVAYLQEFVTNLAGGPWGRSAWLAALSAMRRQPSLGRA